VQAYVLQTNQLPPQKKTATLPEEQQQPPKQNKIKQTKSSNSNEIPTRESQTVSNKPQLQTKSTTLGKTQFKCSRPDTREWQRHKENRETDGDKERQKETRERKREPRGDERESLER
jgi:hypothetical protein